MTALRLLCAVRRTAVPAAAALALWLTAAGCQARQDEAHHGEPHADEADFQPALEAFRTARLADLQQPDGWLSLAGLYWLQPGDNTFGAGPENDLLFPEGKAPDRLGTITLIDSTVTARIAPGADVQMDGQGITQATLSPADDGTAPVLAHGTLSWYVIRRGARWGIRLKDSQNPPLLQFAGLASYPADAAWRVAALFEPYDPPRMLPVPNILGTVDEQASEGRLVFTIAGTDYSLDVLRDGDEERFFLIFADATNGPETYGGGRYLKTDLPDAQRRVLVDFNQAYNPPCVFTPYATCPLPVPQNRLPIRIPAGEKKYAK